MGGSQKAIEVGLFLITKSPTNNLGYISCFIKRVFVSLFFF